MQTPQRTHTEQFQYRAALKWIESCCAAFVENILTEVSMCETVTVNNLSCENHFSADPKMFFCRCREAQHFPFVYPEVTRHDSMTSQRLCSHLWLLVLTKEPLDASGTILNPSAHTHTHSRLGFPCGWLGSGANTLPHISKPSTLVRTCSCCRWDVPGASWQRGTVPYEQRRDSG